MNTYQMHTLSLFLFYHILTTSRSPFAALFDFFFVFLTLPPVSPAHFLSVFLMVCHTDGTYPAVLYNVPLYMYMCMHIPAHICRVPTLYTDVYVTGLCSTVISLLLFIITSPSRITFVCAGRPCANFICCVCAFHVISDLITGLCGDDLICRL